MDGWTISCSPGDGFSCAWCKLDVDSGYFIAKHPNWPDDWHCLSCCLELVRRNQRARAIKGTGGAR